MGNQWKEELKLKFKGNLMSLIMDRLKFHGGLYVRDIAEQTGISEKTCLKQATRLANLGVISLRKNIEFSGGIGGFHLRVVDPGSSNGKTPALMSGSGGSSPSPGTNINS